MRAALLLALLLPGPALAQDRCILACDVVVEGVEARAAVEALLGTTLPPEAEAVGVVEGGFQDRFVQIRVDLPDSPVVEAVLAALGTALADLAPTEGETFGPSGPAWFDVADRGFLRVGRGTLPGFAQATVGLAPGSEGRVSLFVWAFQT